MRKLRLSRETLTELSSDELVTMGGGWDTTITKNWTPVVYTIPINTCVGTNMDVTPKVTLKCPSQPPTCYCTPMP